MCDEERSRIPPDKILLPWEAPQSLVKVRFTFTYR